MRFAIQAIATSQLTFACIPALLIAVASFGVSGCELGRGCRAEPADLPDAAIPEPAAAAPVPKLAKNQEVLFVGGLMSELYEELSLHLEDELNAALDRSARSLNVHIPLPGDRSIDLAVGDAIADSLPRLEIPIEPGRFISFYTQMRELESEGIAYRNASLESPAFDTSDGVEHNARAIRALLRSSRKQVIVVSHSKGSLDTLQALLDAPELWGKTVIAWVALQAPFYGSPLADPATSSIHDMLLRSLGGNGQAIDDLTTSTRAAYMEAHEEQITALTSRIPVITAYSVYETDRTVREFAGTFASGVFDATVVTEVSAIVADHYRASPGDIPHVIAASTRAAVALISDRISNASSAALGTIGIFTLTNAYLDDILGLPNDGLVPRDSTGLPGAIHRELDTGDHASPVMDVDPLKNFWTAEHRNRVTWELIHEVREIAEDAAKSSKLKPR